jgi:hypothetical protein
MPKHFLPLLLLYEAIRKSLETNRTYSSKDFSVDRWLHYWVGDPFIYINTGSGSAELCT